MEMERAEISALSNSPPARSRRGDGHKRAAGVRTESGEDGTDSPQCSREARTTTGEPAPAGGTESAEQLPGSFHQTAKKKAEEHKISVLDSGAGISPKPTHQAEWAIWGQGVGNKP